MSSAGKYGPVYITIWSRDVYIPYTFLSEMPGESATIELHMGKTVKRKHIQTRYIYPLFNFPLAWF